MLENKGEEEEKGCVKESMSVVEEEEKKKGKERDLMCLSYAGLAVQEETVCAVENRYSHTGVKIY